MGLGRMSISTRFAFVFLLALGLVGACRVAMGIAMVTMLLTL